MRYWELKKTPTSTALKKRIEKTLKTRPDLIEKARNCGMWTKEAEKILKEFENE